MKFWRWYAWRFATLQGRVNRRQMLTYFLALYAMFLTPILGLTAVGDMIKGENKNTVPDFLAYLMVLVFLPFIVGCVSLQVRRFHDFGKSGHFFVAYVIATMFFPFAPVILSWAFGTAEQAHPVMDIFLGLWFIAGTLFPIVVLFWPGSITANIYGPPPDDSWVFISTPMHQLVPADAPQWPGRRLFLRIKGMPFFNPDTKFVTDSTLVQRLGLVLWWTGLSGLVLTVIIGIANGLTGSVTVGEFFFVLLIGVLIWLLGRVSLFILASR